MEYFTDLGYLGLFISCFLAATFIIPFSPEVILGILIVKGFSLPVTIFVATIGNSVSYTHLTLPTNSGV